MIGAASGRESRTAAFFDLDGTLVPEPSLERRFFSELGKGRRIPVTNYVRWAVQGLLLLPKGVLAVQQENKRYLAGLSRELVFRYMGSIVFFEEAIARVLWHAQQGHGILIVSGTLEPLAQLAAIALECELEARGIVKLRPRVSATQLKEVRGRWTGEIEGEALYGRAKARCVKAIAAAEKIDLRECHAYGNSLLDRHFLCAAGHGHAVNPGKELASLANEKDWRIWHWQREKPMTSVQDAHDFREIHKNEGAA